MNSFIEREDYCLEKCFFSFTHIKGNLDNKTFVLVYSLSMCSFKSCMKGLSLDWKQQKKSMYLCKGRVELNRKKQTFCR